MNANVDTVSQDELWGLIMRMADPSDILRTILNSARDLGDDSNYRQLVAIRNATMNNCTVIIHQHVLGEPATATLDAMP